MLQHKKLLVQLANDMNLFSFQCYSYLCIIFAVLLLCCEIILKRCPFVNDLNLIVKITTLHIELRNKS